MGWMLKTWVRGSPRRKVRHLQLVITNYVLVGKYKAFRVPRTQFPPRLHLRLLAFGQWLR